MLATLTIGSTGVLTAGESTETLSAGELAMPDVVPQKGVITFERAPEMNLAYGPNTVWTAIGAPQFTPRSGTLSPAYFGTGYVYPQPADNAGNYWAQLDLPNGAEVTQVYMPVYDSDANSYISFYLYTAQAYWSGDSDLKFFGSASSGTTETPGYAIISVTPSSPLVIHEWSDPSGDGTSGTTYSYILVVTSRDAAASASSLRFFGAAVNWTRTISPAPATATFNDVPTGHWAFQHIEALVDSGVTAGCSASNFCPDDTVTRAQMAVFLAKALGLHWGI